MTWIKMDDKAPRHPKIAGLSDRAFRWWVQGLCYASEFLTDGHLPRVFVATVPGKVRAELCDAKLWIADDDALTIHDYLGHQTSRASVEADREAGRKRAERSRLVRANQDRTFARSHTEPPTARHGEVRKPDTDTEADTERRVQNVHPHAPALAGSLPRDHLTHGFCGTRFCVTAKMVSDMARRFGDGGPEAVEAWLQSLNDGLGPHESAGGPVWVLQQFDAFLTASGRVSAPVSGRMTEAERKRADWDAYKRKVRAAEGGGA